MNLKNALIAAVVAAVSAVGIVSCQKSSSGGGSSQYDGTYDWFLGNVGGITSSCSSCVFIKDGKISNTSGSFYGLCTGTPGVASCPNSYPTTLPITSNILFNGPCPNGNASIATYLGVLGGVSRPQWQGTWTCNDGSFGGTSSVWKIFNQH